MAERVRSPEIPWEHSFDDSCPWIISIPKEPGFFSLSREARKVEPEARQRLQRFLASDHELTQTTTPKNPNQIFNAHTYRTGAIIRLEEEWKLDKIFRHTIGPTKCFTYWGVVIRSNQKPLGHQTVIACYDISSIKRGRPHVWPTYLLPPIIIVGGEEHRRIEHLSGETVQTLRRINWLEAWQLKPAA